MSLRDIRYTLRTLLRTPAFTVVAVVSLALGTGVNSAIFSVADALILRPLAVPKPGEVITVSGSVPDNVVSPLGSVSYPDYLDFRQQNKSFHDVAAAALTRVGVAEQPGALPELRVAQIVSGNFLRELEIEPALGRGFSPEEDLVPGRDAVALLSYDMWAQQFAFNPKVIGRTIRVNEVEFRIVGVAPKGFTGTLIYFPPDLYLPAAMWPKLLASRDSYPIDRRDFRSFIMKGRLKPGISQAQSAAEATTIARRLEDAYPETNRQRGFVVMTEMQLRAAQSPVHASMAAMTMGLAGLVLIVACANVANLLLGRAQSRSREMAVRLAIGAGRGRVLRQLLTESLILAAAGGVLGLLLARLCVSYIVRFYVGDLPIKLTIQMDQRVLLFTLLAAVVSAMAFGLAPAIHSIRTDLVPALKSGESGGSLKRTFGRNALVVAQVAVSLMLLCAAALIVRTFQSMVYTDPGFRTDHLVMLSFDPGLAHFTGEQTSGFYRTLLDRARALPGVTRAALGQGIPFEESLSTRAVVPEGVQLPPGRDSFPVSSGIVGDEYFETMGTPLVRGRGFTAADTTASPRVAVINEIMASLYWPGEDPVGKRFRVGGPKGSWVEVVGVAKNTWYLHIAEDRMPFFFLPFAQNPWTRMMLLVETPDADASAMAESLRNLVRSIDANQPVFNVRTMRNFYNRQGLQWFRLTVQLVVAMGIVGVVLAVIGLYALVAYSVSRRTREIGIRMAIGAARRDIVRMVLSKGAALTFTGAILGLAGSFALVNAIRAAFTRLQDYRILDPWTFLAVPAALLGVAMVASYLPARRAAATDPNRALRYE